MTIQEVRQMLPEKIDRYLVDLYRAWDAVEREKYKNSVIDFDLAPPQRVPVVVVNDREEVLDRLEKAVGDLEGEVGSLVELARARLKASATYLRTLLGESIAFRPYIEQTLGVKPRVFSDQQIAAQRVSVAAQLWEQYRIEFSEPKVGKFRGRFEVYNNKQLPDDFKRFRSKWVPELLEDIPVPLDKYKVNVEFAREDAYWKNWISGDLSKHEMLLRINIHPRQVWYEGFPETLVIHEYCGHAVQMVNWHRRIEQRKLPEFLGILTVHFPDQFLLEGLAESLVYVLPGRQQLEIKSIVSRELNRYYLLIMNNVHIIANEESTQTALEYGDRNLPFTRRESIEKEIRDRTQNPLFRCYQYVYGIAKESFLAALSRLGRKRGWELLRLVYDWPMTPTHFEKIVSRLAAKAAEPVGRRRMA